MSGPTPYEIYLQRMQKHYPHGKGHDQMHHGYRYGPRGEPLDAPGRSKAIAHDLEDHIDD
jgi:hypothetical protein